MDSVVELVCVDTVDLCYVKVAVGGDPVEHSVEEFDSGETEFRWEHYLEEALAKGQNSKKGSQGGPIFLHFLLILFLVLGMVFWMYMDEKDWFLFGIAWL